MREHNTGRLHHFLWYISSNPLEFLCFTKGLVFCFSTAFSSHLWRTSKGYPEPYPSPTPATVHPPSLSAISWGHSTALSRSLILCLKEWTTHPLGTFWTQPLIQSSTCRVSFISLFKAVSRKQQAILWLFIRTSGCPQRRTYQWYRSLTSLGLQPPRRMCLQSDMRKSSF